MHFFELVRLPVFTKQSYYFPLKAILLWAGVLSAIPTIVAGKLIESQFTDISLVELHERFQLSAVFVFSVLAIAYIISWIQTKNALLTTFRNLILNTPLVFILPLIGFSILMIGSTIGGIIAFGPNTDPFTSLISSFIK